MKYEDLGKYSKEGVEAAISEENVEKLIKFVVAVSMFADDGAWAESVCLRMAKHPNYNFRGNAIFSEELSLELGEPGASMKNSTDALTFLRSIPAGSSNCPERAGPGLPMHIRGGDFMVFASTCGRKATQLRLTSSSTGLPRYRALAA